ncbi:EAL domain-containing protein [Segnochrobactraceae bacterium EtOH-i3]
MALVLCLVTFGCIFLTRLPGHVASAWLPNALALGFIRRTSPEDRWVGGAAAAVGILIGNLVWDFSLLAPLGLTLANLVEIGVAVVLTDRVQTDTQPITQPSRMVFVLLAAGVIAPLAGAASGAAILSALGIAGFVPVFGSWWIGSFLGAVLVLPALLTVDRAALVRLCQPRVLAELILFIALTVPWTVVSLKTMRFPFVGVAVPMMIAAARLDVFRTSLVGIVAAVTVLVVGVPDAGARLGAHVALPLTLLPAIFLAMVKDARIRSERLARESEATFRRAMDDSAIGMALVSLDGHCIRVNEAFCDMLGYSRSELVGRSFRDFTFPDDLAADLDHLQSTLDGRIDSYRMEKRYVRQDGQIIWALLAVSLVRDPDTGRPQFFVSQIEDIDARKTAVARLAEAESRWAFALDSAGQGVWDRNLVTGRTFYSATWKTMLGLPAGLSLDDAMAWLALIHPDDRERVAAVDAACLRGETDLFEAEFRMRHADGHWVWVMDRGRVIERDPAGHPLRMIGTHTDITTLRTQEAEIRTLAERMELAVEAGDIGIWDFDIASDRVTWDVRMFEQYGIAPEEFRGTRAEWHARIHPADRGTVVTGMRAAIASLARFDTEMRILRGDGEVRNIRVMADVVAGPDGVAERVVGVHWDITATHTLTEALQEEKERLRITLYSIGDAVITTDADMTVTFMNPVAEKITGWTAVESFGRPLEDVFHLIDEASGERIMSPVEMCLKTLHTFYLQDGAALISRSGERYSVQDSAAPVRAVDGSVLGAVLVFQDVTRTRSLQRELAHSALHDALTGLPNRLSFERSLTALCAETRDRTVRHALCFIDLDRFKIVNDSAGHAAGDALLREVGRLLSASVRHGDIVARLGGDEFALLLFDCPVAAADRVANSVVSAIRGFPFQWQDKVYGIGASVGLTEIAGSHRDPAELMKEADVACYAAKNAGRNQVSIYQPGVGEADRHRRDMTLASGLRAAIEFDRFVLYAQEVVDLRPDRDSHRHYEVLLRLRDDDGAMISPGLFIPIAERYNLMGDIDRWVIKAVVRDFGDFLRDHPEITLAINLSANSLDDPALWAYVDDVLTRGDVNPGQIHFEVTETAFINNLSTAVSFAAAARARGCRIVIDDFGVGFSSFGYLRQFHADYLKIDGSFVRAMGASPRDALLVEAMASVGRTLGVVTVAECVETEAMLADVKRLGIDMAQGFLLSRPTPMTELFSCGEAERLSA